MAKTLGLGRKSKRTDDMDAGPVEGEAEA